MVETALVMTVVLMLTFGAIQVAMIGFSQTSQDGAAFVAAHEYAQNVAGGAGVAQAAAHQIFSRVAVTDVSVATSPGRVTASSAVSAVGLGLPGTPGTFPLEATATEPVALPMPTPRSGGVAYPFSTSGQLSNYRSYADVANPAYAFVTAQTFDAGNGVNGFFGEFDCREKVYSGLSFPSYPKTRSSAWDPQNGTYRQIYQWDTGATCS